MPVTTADVKARAMREALLELANHLGEQGQESITQVELVEYARTRWAEAPRHGHPLCFYCSGFGTLNGLVCAHCSKPSNWEALETRRKAQEAIETQAETEQRHPCIATDCDATLLRPWHTCHQCGHNQIPF